LRPIVGDPRLARRRLPNERFNGRSSPAVGAASINGVPAFGLPKNQQLLRPHRETRPRRIGTKSIRANTMKPALLQERFEPVHRLGNGMGATGWRAMPGLSRLRWSLILLCKKAYKQNG